MCLGGIQGAVICIPAAPGCAAHRPGKRDAPASGACARSASKVPRGGRVPRPALQSSGPADCLKRDEAKAVMAAWDCKHDQPASVLWVGPLFATARHGEGSTSDSTPAPNGLALA